MLLVVAARLRGDHSQDGLPTVGKRVQSVKGDGKVLRQNILKQTVLIQREEDGGVVEAALQDLVDARPQA